MSNIQGSQFSRYPDTSVVPAPQIPTTPATGLTGKGSKSMGLAPRQANAPVNTGFATTGTTPDPTNAFKSVTAAIDTVSPFAKTGSTMNFAMRPSLNDILTHALAGASAGIKLAAEEDRKDKDRRGEKDKDDKEKDACGPGMKTASAEDTHLLIDAGRSCADGLRKIAASLEVGEVGTAKNEAGTVTTPSASGQQPQPTGHSAAHGKEPMSRTMDAGKQMQNTETDRPGGNEPGQRISDTLAKKASAAPISMIAKMASMKAPISTILKMASGTEPVGPGTGEPVRDGSQPAGPHPGGKPAGATHVVASNQAAVDYTKRDAKAPEKREAAKTVDEAMQSASTDPVLNQAFAHTGEAGAKIAAAIMSGKSVDTAIMQAAGRAVLTKIAAAQSGRRALCPTAQSTC